MGFCLFNHVAVSAAALAASGERVAIVDFDAHHGNGTQDIFYERDDVLYVSWHQFPLYPGTGRLTERGQRCGPRDDAQPADAPGCDRGPLPALDGRRRRARRWSDSVSPGCASPPGSTPTATTR